MTKRTLLNKENTTNTHTHKLRQRNINLFIKYWYIAVSAGVQYLRVVV